MKTKTTYKTRDALTQDEVLDRIRGSSVKHLQQVFKHCNELTGRTGFDIFRNDETDTKEKFLAYLFREFSAETLVGAHWRAVDSYPKNAKRRGRPRKPATSTNTYEAPTMPDPMPVTITADQNCVMKSFTVTNEPQSITKADSQSETIARLLAELSRPQIDEDVIKQWVRAEIMSAKGDVEDQITRAVQSIRNGPTVVELQIPELEPVELGIQHKQFTTLLKMCNARTRDGLRLNIWLAGPKGSGKTSAAKHAATALGLRFFGIGAIDQGYKLTGYLDANGNYARTGFREAWECGGVFLFDEIDGSSANATVELNSALANGFAVFPDVAEPVERHPDCVVIAGANTYGQGGTAEYNGRSKLDAAFLDRFVMLDWPTDEALERALCANVGWVDEVQLYRRKVQKASIRGAEISTRATIYGEALLAAGLSRNCVVASTIRKGMTDDQWGKVSTTIA